MNRVAPRVGAWIETLSTSLYAQKVSSHPVWVRGLKLVRLFVNIVISQSHPVWVRGLKRSRVRYPCRCMLQSHPVWVRGLKLPRGYLWHVFIVVAPRVGAWIETMRYDLTPQNVWSHPVWVRGLKHIKKGLLKQEDEKRRTPCGCVD